MSFDDNFPLVNVPEPVMLVTRSHPGIWVNRAFFEMGGWNSATASLSDVLDASEIRRIRSATSIDEEWQLPGQVEVRYQLPSSASSRRMWLHFRPLLPILPPWRDVGDGRTERSSTVWCTCAWAAAVDYYHLLHQFVPGRIKGFEIDFSRGDARYWFINRAAAQLLASAANVRDALDKYVGKDVELPKEEIDWWIAQVKSMTEQNIRELDVKRPLSFKGNIFVVKHKVILVPGPWNKLRCLVFSEDVTEQEHLAEELAAKRIEVLQSSEEIELLRRFFAQAPVIMGVALLESYDTAQCRYRDFVHIFTNKVNGDPTSLLHKKGSELSPQADVDLWLEKCCEAQSMKQAVQFDWRSSISVLGFDRYYSVTIHWLSDKRYLYLMTDVTERKQYTQELEREVTVRTRDLEQAIRVKHRFLAMMSHELRTPLSGIMSSTMLLKDSLSDDELVVPLHQRLRQQRELVHILRVCGEQLASLLDDVMETTRLHEQKFRLEPVEFSPAELLQESLELAAFNMTTDQKRAVELLNDIDEESLPPRLVGDARRIRQVIVNLLQNAINSVTYTEDSIRFTPSGEVSLTCNAQIPNGASQCRLYFVVRDTGVGIPEKLRDKVFEPFSRGDDSLSRTTGGMGLGLYICHRLVALMDGVICFESATSPPNSTSGTAFYVQLPLERSISCPLPPKSVCVVSATPRVLIVCLASPRICRRLEMLFKQRGFETEMFYDLKAAQPRFRDAILLIEGHVTTLQLDQIIPAPERVIVIDYDRPKCPFHAEFVQKPFRPAVLVERLCLRHERGRLTDDAQHETDDVASPSMLQRCAPRAERILIAEDNLMNQKIIRKLLEKQGWSKITFVSNGLDAVKVVQEHATASAPFHYVLMDIMMPVMNGLEATKQIRDLPISSSQPKPKIIALTANATPEQRAECERAGMDDYLTKPIKPLELQAALADYAKTA